ncbi:MAG: SpoIIE family protein phosphatase [Erysipelotrichaceae bacterium]|nr:SpoIIE family protein phosphatase [Erysipelotrichaceae bacterium]
MPKKSYRELSEQEKRHYSLSSRIFRMILIFSVILSAVAVLFGFYLYADSVRRDYETKSGNLARTLAEIIRVSDADKYIDKVLKAYEAGASSSEYMKMKNEGYQRVDGFLAALQEENRASFVYVAAYDKQDGRLIYVFDSDRSEKHCEPGTYEYVDEKESSLYGTEETCYIGISEKYGNICTGWELLEETDRYYIMTFADYDMNEVNALSLRYLGQYCLLLFAVTILLDVLIVRHFRKDVVRPIELLSQAAEDYRLDKIDGGEQEIHFRDLPISSGDEIEKLSLVMEDMEKDIADYVDSLMAATAEKERISSELSIASQIQDGMLPGIFPAFPERSEFDIYALMHPAKEVGGDFYDFYLLDEDHLAMTIADVSGKGVPGALFMMASKILLSNTAALYPDDPAAILKFVNEKICEKNKAEMFITVWLGILEISTGRLIAANGGHEYPILSKEGHFEHLKDRHGFVLGGLSGVEYTNYELYLKPGDCLFVYTDGAVEAVNAAREQFGRDRLLEALNSHPQVTPEELLQEVSGRIEGFVKNEKQFDDITMMALRYHGKKDSEEIRVDAVRENVTQVTEFIDRILEKNDCSIKAQTQIDVAVDEIFSNIVSYAYPEKKGDVRVEVKVLDDQAEISFFDRGIPFDPLEIKEPDTTLSIEERGVGGLGIFLVRKTMDDMRYEYKDGQNILTIVKKIH